MIFGVSIKKCSGVSIFAPDFWLLAGSKDSLASRQLPAARSQINSGTKSVQKAI
jgi:hypothetical protein